MEAASKSQPSLKQPEKNGLLTDAPQSILRSTIIVNPIALSHGLCKVAYRSVEFYFAFNKTYSLVQIKSRSKGSDKEFFVSTKMDKKKKEEAVTVCENGKSHH